MRKFFVLRLNVHTNVIAIKIMESRIVKGRLARGASKKIRSIQYSASHSATEIGIAGCDQRLPVHMLHNSTAPAAAQIAPVMDRYSGLRLA